MDPPPAPTVEAVAEEDGPVMPPAPARRDSSSQQSDNSQTAAEFIREQMQLEQDAREALPYSIENCTKPLGPLRQSVFACLTCNPAPSNPSDSFNPAGVCYACSVQCHGEHTLVEIFNKRNFTCDCGTTRFPASSACSLRINSETNTKGGVHSELPDVNNKYNQNFRNHFCGCECDYDPFQQKGTMFQCLGLGTPEDGGCGEDWWHAHCVVGLPHDTDSKTHSAAEKTTNGATGAVSGNSALPTISEDENAPQTSGNDAVNGDAAEAEAEDNDPPLPPGFPAEDDFEAFLCYKCVEAHPWIKQYAGSPGFLLPVYHKKVEAADPAVVEQTNGMSNKRKAEDDEAEQADTQDSKRLKSESEQDPASISVPEQIPAGDSEAVKTETKFDADAKPACKLLSLPPAPEGKLSLFLTESFRDSLCRCSNCFPLLQPHPQLLEEEETYEPPVSDDGSEAGGSTHGSGSLYERGESALRNVDRVRAIEGVMAYNHLKEQLKPFFQEFAESGKAISAEDIKAYFAKLRGDDAPAAEGAEVAGDTRREQSGY